MGDSYRASLDYLYSLQLFGIKLGLEKVRELLKRIGDPQRSMRIVHIAGTNGKGSTAAALANIFAAAGIRAGLYTSPHLHSFTERVRVDLQQISEAEVVALTDEIRPHAEELRTTFFEFTTALALLYFQRSGAEWVVLETGMGGRLDATNAVSPELCLVTPIALDHTAYLGTTLAAVAAEKAGIIKPGIPVLSARQLPEAEAVLRQQAGSVQSPLGMAGEAYDWQPESAGFSFFSGSLQLRDLLSGLVGRHQQQNLALALAAAVQLRRRGVAIPEQALRDGIARTRWPGRLEWLPGKILLDGAHNPGGVAVLADYLQEQRLRGVHLVIGMKADKQSEAMLSQLLPFVAQVYATSPPVDAALAPQQLVEQARRAAVAAAAYDQPQAALAAARAKRQPGEVILVAGSLFLVAALREQLLPASEVLSICGV